MDFYHLKINHTEMINEQDMCYVPYTTAANKMLRHNSSCFGFYPQAEVWKIFHFALSSAISRRNQVF